MTVQIILAAIFVIAGLFFLTISGVGILRLPDFYSRTHAVGKSETLGSILLLCGLAIYNGFQINSLKILLILLFIALANPTATHIIARAAVHSGLQPWIVKNKKIRNDVENTQNEQSESGDTVQDKQV